MKRVVSLFSTLLLLAVSAFASQIREFDLGTLQRLGNVVGEVGSVCESRQLAVIHGHTGARPALLVSLEERGGVCGWDAEFFRVPA